MAIEFSLDESPAGSVRRACDSLLRINAFVETLARSSKPCKSSLLDIISGEVEEGAEVCRLETSWDVSQETGGIRSNVRVDAGEETEIGS